MSNRVLLIRPQNVYNYNNYPPLNLISIGSKLKSAGYDVKIINCAFENDSLDAISRELHDVLFAGISLLTSESPDAYRIMKHVKEKSNIPSMPQKLMRGNIPTKVLISSFAIRLPPLVLSKRLSSTHGSTN